MSKALRNVKTKAAKEAEKIFVKNNQTGPLSMYKNKVTGSYPKIDDSNRNTPYGKEARRVEDQVTKYRVKQYKATKPKTAEQIFKGIDKAVSYIKRKRI